MYAPSAAGVGVLFCTCGGGGAETTGFFALDTMRTDSEVVRERFAVFDPA